MFNVYLDRYKFYHIFLLSCSFFFVNKFIFTNNSGLSVFVKTWYFLRVLFCCIMYNICESPKIWPDYRYSVMWYFLFQILLIINTCMSTTTSACTTYSSYSSSIDWLARYIVPCWSSFLPSLTFYFFCFVIEFLCFLITNFSYSVLLVAVMFFTVVNLE